MNNSLLVGVLDGFADLLLSADDPEVEFKEGAAYVVLGSAAGIPTGAVDVVGSRLEANQVDAELGGGAGESVASAGDVNGDGFGDVIVGAHRYDAVFAASSRPTACSIVAAIDRICTAAKSAGLPIGSFGLTPQVAETDMRRGATLICTGTDALLLGRAAEEILAQFKELDR